MEKSTSEMTYEELAQFNQDTRDSIRGKNNYKPEPWGGNVVYPIYPDNSYEQMLNRIEQEDTFDPS